MTKESLEALLNPSLRVSRPVAACARCRSAKIKCDGKLPACSACERSGKAKECSSANDEFARGKERSYVAALETTVQRLQKKINEAKGSNSASQQNTTGRRFDSRPPFQRRPMSSSSRQEAYDVDDLVSDLGFLTVNATSRDFHGFTSTMSFARLLLATSMIHDLPQLNDLSLPSRSSITHLINNYFENLYVILPFFSETDFMSSLSRIYQDTNSVSTASPTDVWYVRLVLAISYASRCQSKGDASYEASMHHLSAAMKYAEYVLHPGSISGIQALLLLVQYSLFDPEHLDLWYLIGMAARLLVDLGLHCEPAQEAKITKQALDLRRRIFYCTFALDRMISMSLGHAFSFTDDSAPNVLLPTLATDLERRSSAQLFLRSVRPSLFLFDIRRVQSSYYQRTRSSARNEWGYTAAAEYVSSTLNDVQSWHSTLPISFSHTHLQAFHLEYLYSEVLAVSPSQVIPLASMSRESKALLFQFSVQHAEHMQMIVQTSDMHQWLAYPDFCRSRFVARQFQTLMWTNFDLMVKDQSNPGARPSENCNKAISFLNNTSQILDFVRQRWGLSDLRERFEQESAVLLARLRNKQQELSMPQFLNSSSTTQQAQKYPQTSLLMGSSNLNHPIGTRMEDSDNTFLSHAYVGSQTRFYATDAGPAMHRSNLSRAASWGDQGSTPALNLPQGTLPRRSYEFHGGDS